MPYTQENPRPLETVFQYKKRTFKQERRDGRVALYSITNAEGRVIQWEVILIDVATNTFNGPVEPYESYPGKSAFGKRGWGFQFEAPAVARFEKLVAIRNGTYVEPEAKAPEKQTAAPKPAAPTGKFRTGTIKEVLQLAGKCLDEHEAALFLCPHKKSYDTLSELFEGAGIPFTAGAELKDGGLALLQASTPPETLPPEQIIIVRAA